MSDEPRKDGLGCVYGVCRANRAIGLVCNPGCSFTMSAIPDAAFFCRVIDPRDARIAELEAENVKLREALIKSQAETWELMVGEDPIPDSSKE